MNKKGFTLVELLGVLIVISVIMIIVITPIIGQIRNSSSKLDEATLSVLYTTAEKHLNNNKRIYPLNDGAEYYISVSNLIHNEELQSNFLTSYSEDLITKESIIKVTVVDGEYTFSWNEEVGIKKSLSDAYLTSDNDSVYNYVDGSYFAGQVTNNYVYYSGFMWRIMGKNKDGSIKLITDEVVTSLSNGISSSYKTGYLREWLNDYFYSRLKYSDYIVESEYCYNDRAASTSNIDRCNQTASDMFDKKKVYLLSIVEYNKSLINGVSYLKKGIDSTTLTFSAGGSPGLILFDTTNLNPTVSLENFSYIRPIINLIPEAPITAGDGTKTNPYILFKNTSLNNNDKQLNSINLSCGEYVKLNNKVYRVVDTDNKETKLILNELYNVSGSTYVTSFGTNSKFNISNGIGESLNSTVFNREYSTLNTIIKNGFWYQGDSTVNSVYYKNSTLSKNNLVDDVSVGLPKIGELLTAPIYDVTTNPFWTITKYNDATVYTVAKTAVVPTTTTATSNVRPVIVVDSNILISGGNGTSLSPYEIKN